MALVTTCSMLVALVVNSSIGAVMPTKRNTPEQRGVAIVGFQLRAQLDKKSFSSDESVWITLLTKNMTNEERTIVAASAVKIYRFTVRNERGVPVSLTEYGKAMEKSPEDFLERAFLKLGPGREVSDKLQINKLYEMRAIGTYYITAKRTVFRRHNEGTAEVVSNTVRVRVVG